MNEQNLKRPSGEEDEEDLLKMQAEFLSSKSIPCAQVKRVAREGPPTKNQGIGSPYVKNTSAKQAPVEKPSPMVVDYTDFDTDVPVLLAITENEIDPKAATAPSLTRESFHQPFKVSDNPVSKNESEKKETKVRGPSLFAQQLKKKAVPKPFFVPPTYVPASAPPAPTASAPAFNSSSEVLKESDSGGRELLKEMKDIDLENKAKISSMAEEEIKQYQQQLLAQLGPDMVNFIKSRQKFGKEMESKTSVPDETKQDSGLGNKFKKGLKPNNSNDLKQKVNQEDLDLPIDPGEAKMWPHMDKLELDKMAWMSKLPPPKLVDPNTGQPARFDFKGLLIWRDEEISIQQGLHHHGQEPEVAGYTVEELFHLSRSSVASQKILALQTLARVLHNNNLGLFDDVIDTKLIAQLLDAGIAFLLRWAIDDSQVDVTSAALYALHELIVSHLDEHCLDSMFAWQGGYFSPYLKPRESAKVEKGKENVDEMPDSDIVGTDVIQGLLRMDVLLRLRYILEVLRPNDQTIVKHALGILIRIARHSLQAATQIMDCPHLLQTIFVNFIPIHSTQNENTYGTPQPLALKLVRCLSTAGRHISKRLIQDFNLRFILNAYIASESSDSSLSELRLEALRTWKVLLSYGFAGETWLDLFPILMKHLQHCQGLDLIGTRYSGDLHYTALLLASLQGLIVISGSPNPELMSRVLFWNQTEDLYRLVCCLTQKWIQELITFGFGDITIGLGVLTSALNFLTTFLLFEKQQPNMDVVNVNVKVENFLKLSFLPLLHSDKFSQLTNNCHLRSELLSNCNPGEERDSPILPSLGAVQWKGKDVSFGARDSSPFPLLVALTSFTQMASQIHCLTNQMMLTIYERFSIYMNKVVHEPKLRHSWFNKQEVYLLHNLVHLFSRKVIAGDTEGFQPRVPHQVSLLLPALVTSGEGHLTEDLLSSVVFNAVFFSEQVEEATFQMSTLSTDEPPSLSSATGRTLVAKDSQILQDTMQALPSIKNIYLAQLRSHPYCQQSRWRLKQECHLVDSLSFDCFPEITIFRMDWPTSPIQGLYDLQVKSESEKVEGVGENSVSSVRFCLLWLHFLMVGRSSYIKSWEPGMLFTTLCSVFLISDDLFLESDVQVVLHCLFRRIFYIFKPSSLQLEKVQHPAPFLTFYQGLLSHFESVSYGDSLFACSVLVPLQQCYSPIYKQTLLTEHASCIRLLRLPLKQMLVPINNYLHPLEEDFPLLKMYLMFLQSGSLTHSPLLFAMATHHLHHYIFSPQRKENVNQLMDIVWRNRKKPEILGILMYSGVDTIKGVAVSETVSSERKQFLKELGYADF